jgi:hypothetical protein
MNTTINKDKIALVEQIVHPYFRFNMNDIYGDHPNGYMPDVEEIKILYFKLQTTNKTIIGNKKQEEIANKVKQLNIGTVNLITIPSFGRYIQIIL